MKKAVILGAGLATRLYPVTHHIPKVLVNYKQHTILKNLHDIYADLGADEIYVVVHSKFAETVVAYAEQEGLNIIVHTVDEAYGSAYALATMSKFLEGHNVIVNWCDIIPDFGSWSWDQNAIYVKGNECRYKFDGDSIKNVGDTGGNVVGIYQFRDWEFWQGESKEEIHDACRGRDFVEFIYPKVFTYSELLNLIDLGDMIKLHDAHKDRELNRSFNSVEMHEHTVEKIAVTEQGKKLQEKELSWYRSVSSDATPFIEAVTENSFVMERIKGLPAFEWLYGLPADHQFNKIEDILEALNFGNEVYASENTIERDFTKEFYTKVIDRCESIQGVVNSFGKITHVNGVKLGRLKPMLKQALSHLIYHHHETQGRQYSVIHGDPNFSNTMIQYDGKVRFIDPRGYFGETEIYGPRLYDEAKVLYAISGYDSFNANHAWGGLTIDDENAWVNIAPLVYKYEKTDMFNEYHHLAVAIIWIALGGYFKNNPLKATAAYYYGMMLLTKQLRKMGRRLQDDTVSFDEAEPVVATLITKNPGKWVLLDKETGVEYRPVGGDIKHQWEPI
ncbi:Hypothetical protein KNT65_gp041 [Escherichia phage EcS1]|uniref:Nucleotidyl transferase domain-containing protein n=1 Tax=Escherichia phage EcS1 TaxID=2083276 RepID=A0A2Z5ZBX7_9CAUD|nr:Hypothetical protein KNT65_gp041 [Escherichia phage EcS1]BBC78089.1 Hypothetical protein [Escherichia phage EcS1]